MSSANYESRYTQHPRNDSYYARYRDTDMRDTNPYSYPSSYRSSYEPRAPPLPRRSAAPPQPQYRSHTRKPTWPPAPSAEDERLALRKEVRPSTSPYAGEGEPPVNTRGTVDQEALLEDIEQPDDLRYVLVSDPSTDGSTRRPSRVRDGRRKSFAERGNMAHIKTDVEDPPIFTERVSTPYAYTKLQRESTAPGRAEFLSPEPLTPPRSGPRRDTWDTPRDQHVQPPRPSPAYNRHDPVSRPSPATKNDMFDDSDIEPEDTTHLRTAERKPARYSFVKSDLQKEDLRTNLYNSEPKPKTASRRRDSGQRAPPTFRRHESSSSAKDSPYAESPRSSTSSLNSGTRKSKPAPVETGYYSSSRTPSRPSSPLQRAPSPKLPSRLRESPESSRPSSRGHTRPASPLAFSTTVRPPSPSRVPVTDADWHSTYPPVTTRDRSRPPSRVGRHETMPVPYPRIGVQSPSPARPPMTGGSLPYPVDDRPLDVFMPSEAQYQFDHSSITSPRQSYPDSPRVASSPMPGSPRLRDETYRAKDSLAMPDEPSRTRRTRSASVRSQASVDGRREELARPTKLDLDKPLPSCPRPMPTTKYDDWYNLRGYRNFDICPSCFDGVFANTPFDVNFSQKRLGERPSERFCDFSSPWIRLAWLLTIKQRRPSLELIYKLADVMDTERPCPGDRELSSDWVTWYGVPDQRDGVHVANFAICSCDKKMIEALLPTMRNCFTRLPSTYSAGLLEKYMCSLRTSSRRFPKYLDLLVELETEAQDLSQRPDINRFVQLARDNAFKGECGKDKAYFRKPWHFIPILPEFTVCEECYDEIVWPALQSKSSPSNIPRLFNKAIQLVPGEDSDVGSSCCLYSPRMRKTFETAVREDDFTYLKRKVLERKKAETKRARERKHLVGWMSGLERGGGQWERAKGELKGLDREWAGWE
ncbi:hypothetical protein CC86DRAFT_367822 [Ophiobolus disseminans]|uniref:Uncharacterized protein n=1 Tax=Ophiobolus disseminans TaxID=1469910 RepID=A0A6A7AAM7_9PLEO|nr:hypothetical protein CC86DRAFT_367822 [Ophiobolus disseminans]